MYYIRIKFMHILCRIYVYIIYNIYYYVLKEYAKNILLYELY